MIIDSVELSLAPLMKTLPEALQEEVYSHLFTALKNGEIKVAPYTDHETWAKQAVQVTGLHLEVEADDDRSYGVIYRPVVLLDVLIKGGGRRSIELSI